MPDTIDNSEAVRARKCEREVREATASVALEGFKCSPEQDADFAAYVRGETTIEEILKNWAEHDTPEKLAAPLATLYADLDFQHPFVDGNSRTLREFTRRWVAEKTSQQLKPADNFKHHHDAARAPTA